MTAPRDAIPKKDLVIGKAYLCDGRNLGTGLWNGENFVYIRHKWGDIFVDHEYHFDDGPPYGTCIPIKVLT